MKQYPLVIENVGEETYILMSRGHHDFEAFKDAVVKDRPTWPMGEPKHLWAKATPTRVEGYKCMYSLVPKGTRGAFPITHCQEDCSIELVADRSERLSRVFKEKTPPYIQELIEELRNDVARSQKRSEA